MKINILTLLFDLISIPILQNDEQDTELNSRSRRLARQLEDEDDENFEEKVPQKIYKVNPNKEAVDTLKYLRVAVTPLIETYAVTAFTLDKLVGRQLLESELINDILAEIQSQLSSGGVEYGKLLQYIHQIY